jgi:hypothetical protein
VVDSVVSKLQETGQHVAKKSDLLFARTRGAGEAFFGEVRNAGREIVVLVRNEAKGWRRFLTQSRSRLRIEAKAVFTPKTLERELLSRVDGTLRSLDAKVRQRLGALEKRPARSARKPAVKANGKANGKRRVAAKSAAPAAKTSAPAVKTSPTAASVVAGARH